MQQPRVGTIVHYRSFGTPKGEFTPECRAAIVTEVGGSPLGVIGLTAINPTGLFFHPLAAGGSAYSNGAYAGGTWHFLDDCDA